MDLLLLLLLLQQQQHYYDYWIHTLISLLLPCIM
jgi:hypothetical protein